MIRHLLAYSGLRCPALPVIILVGVPALFVAAAYYVRQRSMPRVYRTPAS